MTNREIIQAHFGGNCPDDWNTNPNYPCNLIDVDKMLTEAKKPSLTDKEIENYIWEEISVPLSKDDIDNQTDNYITYLNAVYWAKWGRDNYNGL